MGLDIRLPIGMMFTLIGALLAINGFLTKADTALDHRSLDININLIWGSVLLIFGGLMLMFALFSKKPADALDSAPEKTESAKSHP